jgi:hypothetical protein
MFLPESDGIDTTFNVADVDPDDLSMKVLIVWRRCIQLEINQQQQRTESLALFMTAKVISTTDVGTWSGVGN